MGFHTIFGNLGVNCGFGCLDLKIILFGSILSAWAINLGKNIIHGDKMNILEDLHLFFWILINKNWYHFTFGTM